MKPTALATTAAVLFAGCMGRAKAPASAASAPEASYGTVGSPGEDVGADDEVYVAADADSPSADALAAPAPAAVARSAAQIAGDSVRAASGLTAGVWDDNLNFEHFAPYARAMAQRSSDLAAFTADEQAAALDRFAQPTARTELDIQLVLDVTGSMGDELGYLQRELDAIAGQVRAAFPDVTPRWSLVVYRDDGDAYVTRPFDFTTDTGRFQRDLAAQAAGGGGDFPEAVLAGFTSGLQQRWRAAPEVARLVFWVADAPPHPGEGAAFARTVRTLRDAGIHVYPVASSGIDDATEYQMRAAAQLTGGRYLFLTDDAGVGNSHAEPHIPCYQVTRLDRAIVRMIEIELTGRHAAPAAPDVLRRVGSPDAEGRCRAGERLTVAF